MFRAKRTTIHVILAILAILSLAACGSPETQKKRLLEAGNKYFKENKFKEASIIYRKALQKDARYGEAYYRLGLSELRMGRFGEALRALERASELQPENEDAHSRLGDLYLSIYLSDKNRFKQLLGDFSELADRMLKKNPNSFAGLRMKGYQYVAENKVAEAASYFEKALKVKPDDASILLAYVQALSRGDERPRALTLAREALAKHKSFGPLYDFLYLNALADKNIPEAESILKSKVDNNPRIAVYYTELAAHYLRARKDAEMRATLARLTSNKKDFPTGHKTAGDFYFRIGAFDSAITEYEAGIQTDPGAKKDYQKRIVEVMNLQGRRGEAVALANKVVEENKDDAEAQAIRASLRMRGGSKEDVDTSIREFQSIIARMPENPVVRFNLGEALMAKGELEQARVQFEEAIKLRSSYLPPRLALSRVYLVKREFPKAKQMSEEILQQAPRSIPGHLIRASALMGLNDLKGAREELGVIFQLSPDNNDAFYLRAMIDYSEGKLGDAEDAFRRLYNAKPMDPRGLLGLVEIAMTQNKAAEARALLEKELAVSKDARVVRLALANVNVRSGDFARAMQEYQILLEKSPDSEDLNLRMGEANLRARQLGNAMKYFEKASQINPQNPLPLLKIAVIHELSNEKSKTKPIYEKILRISPDNPVALNNLAYMMAESGVDLDQALTYAQRAKQKLPNNPDVSDTLGWVYIKKNLSDDAIKIFRDLLQAKPDHVTWRYHLAIALFQKGDKLQAKKELDLALKNNPRPDEQSKIKELLARIG
ncbi:MAG: tetratricopeptide repeat protein [Bryobacterales bacterium]|nr:tetratricopeptide repeat protein [Bryobacterales bacterium]